MASAGRAQRLLCRGREVGEHDVLDAGAPGGDVGDVYVTVVLRARGGKGGFGSLLRASGRKSEVSNKAD
eukprot:PRCOL_00003792-RA